MHIVMLLSKSYRHDPRVQKEAQALRAAGHDITVIQWARHEPDAALDLVLDGVRVLSFHGGRLHQALRNPVLQNPGWWRGATRLALHLHQQRPFQVVHAHDLDTLAAGARIKRRTGARLVFDAHEIFSIMVRHDKGPLVAAAADTLERRLLPMVDHVVTVNEALGAHYRRRVDVPVHLVENCADLPPAPERPSPGPFTVVYVGLLSPARFFPQAVHVLGQLEGVRFVIAGKREGNWEAVRDAAARYDNVTFLGAIPSQQVLATMAAGHAILCMLDPNDPQYRIATATKVLDAMAVARPSIVTEGTYSGELVSTCGCGVAVPYSEDGLREAVLRLRDDPVLARRLGVTGRTHAEDELNWARQVERLHALYAALEAGP